MKLYCIECEEYVEVEERTDDHIWCPECDESCLVGDDPTEAVFQYEEDFDGIPMFLICDKWYRDKFGYWDDQYRGAPWLDSLEGFSNIAEASFEFNGTKEEAVALLQKAGCTELT